MEASTVVLFVSRRLSYVLVDSRMLSSTLVRSWRLSCVLGDSRAHSLNLNLLELRIIEIFLSLVVHA